MTFLDPVLTNLTLGFSPFADFFGPFSIPIAGMAFALGVIIVRVVEKMHQEKLRHETIRSALEKGQALPPELLEGKTLPSEFFAQFARKARDDRRGGLISIGVGLGLFIFFSAMREEGVPDGVKWVSLIPGLIGAALLINWALERMEKKDTDKP
jgi:hypothetical protein